MIQGVVMTKMQAFNEYFYSIGDTVELLYIKPCKVATMENKVVKWPVYNTVQFILSHIIQIFSYFAVKSVVPLPSTNLR